MIQSFARTRRVYRVDGRTLRRKCSAKQVAEFTSGAFASRERPGERERPPLGATTTTADLSETSRSAILNTGSIMNATRGETERNTTVARRIPRFKPSMSRSFHMASPTFDLVRKLHLSSKINSDELEFLRIFFGGPTKLGVSNRGGGFGYGRRMKFFRMSNRGGEIFGCIFVQLVTILPSILGNHGSRYVWTFLVNAIGKVSNKYV